MTNPHDKPTLDPDSLRTHKQDPPPSLVAISTSEAGPLLGASRETASLRNITVLPVVAGSGDGAVELKPRSEPRYQRLRRLGAGAMGEVDLVMDNDIGRTVAKKQLISEQNSPLGIAHFIEEIRIIGRLEHPNIVPIHDVGVDAGGQPFFVMKHIDGETLESIIDKLAAGDPSYCARYTIDARVEIFLGLLHALQCAHNQGIVHRDIKPANVMVGRFGEVVLMDWGVAKSLKPTDTETAARLTTQQGQIIGTPAYMSPEQASGNNAEVDSRSDLYSASVLFHELLAVRHYLSHCRNVTQTLFSVLGEEYRYSRLLFIKHPLHPVPPAEHLHFIVKGLAKNRDDRHQSADEMIWELQRMRDGLCRVSCPATLAKRMINTSGRFVSRFPKLSPFIFYSVLLTLVVYVAITARLLIRHGI